MDFRLGAWCVDYSGAVVAVVTKGDIGKHAMWLMFNLSLDCCPSRRAVALQTSGQFLFRVSANKPFARVAKSRWELIEGKFVQRSQKNWRRHSHTHTHIQIYFLIDFAYYLFYFLFVFCHFPFLITLLDCLTKPFLPTLSLNTSKLCSLKKFLKARHLKFFALITSI